MDRARIGVHRCPGTGLRRKRHTQTAVLRQRREPSNLDPGSALGRPLKDRSGASVTERQRRELLAHHRADLTPSITDQIRNVPPPDHPPAADPPLPNQIIENEHASQHPRTRIREVKAHRTPGADRFLQRHAHRRLELHPQTPDMTADARHDQHIEILRNTVRMRQGVARRAKRERVGILALANDMTLTDTRQPLKLNASPMLRARHQLIATQPILGNTRPDRSETARIQPTARRAADAALQRHPMLATAYRPVALLHTPISSPARPPRAGVTTARAAYSTVDLHAQARPDWKGPSRQHQARAVDHGRTPRSPAARDREPLGQRSSCRSCPKSRTRSCTTSVPRSSTRGRSDHASDP